MPKSTRPGLARPDAHATTPEATPPGESHRYTYSFGSHNHTRTRTTDGLDDHRDGNSSADYTAQPRAGWPARQWYQNANTAATVTASAEDLAAKPKEDEARKARNEVSGSADLGRLNCT